ncbi:MAG: tRNA (N(6)-L-threonylcarbamoyladenosine(37)-C(2))-methylthiotransferase MtaB [Candidatus Marinimicrobia bacterium]|nr:tRNA (N(6)-L-threonylcarbamoyladenosine(37)-C(2))-methylthiotransferase MtaB [Candidatus Neomarinimicrobiota bacterium]
MLKNEQKVAFHTIGCKLNYAETSSISRQFESAGYVKTDFHEVADLYVINTCSVTENADRDFRKLVNRTKRLSPQSKIAVIGCYAQLKPDLIAETTAVDVVLGAREKFNLIQYVNFESNPQSPLVIQDVNVEELHGCIPSYSVGDRTRSFLKIQDGCDYPCTYCTIPLARGRSRSIDPDILVQQTQEIVSQGVREIVLTGVNVGDYHFGDGQDLLHLLQRLDVVEGIERIRISSIEPNLLTNEILEFVAGSTSVLPHFHIPLQSGSDKILGLMKRRYKTDLYRERIHSVRKVLPEAGIGIDVIVGFPGEDQAEFERTRHFLESIDFSYLHVFTYSERPNTESINFPGKVSMIDRKMRNRALTDLSDNKNQAFARRQMGTLQNVLFESWESGSLSGMSENYLKIRVQSENQDLVNQIAQVELGIFTDECLQGTIITK